MRLTPQQTGIILDAVRLEVGISARTVLFGSRVNDAARGGDVDLLIETDEIPPIYARARIHAQLEDQLDLPVDILHKRRDSKPTAFQEIAMLTGMELV